MRFTFSHETVYRYSVPVGLAPHVLRLNPRPDAGRLLSRSLIVEPFPDARFDEFDAYGNGVTRLAFAGTPTLLRIDTT